MKTDEKLAADWFLLGCERLKAADSLRKAEGITFSGVELLQEAVERYLKGYLIALDFGGTYGGLVRIFWGF